MRIAFVAIFFSFVTFLGLDAIARAGQLAPNTVRFDYTHHEVLVEVFVNNSGPYTFLLDTDTTPSAIDRALAQRLHIVAVGDAAGGNGIGNGSSSVTPVKLARVDVNGTSARNLDAVALDLSGVSARLGRRLDGVLGTSFLENRVVQIDYRCRAIAFLPDASLEPFTARFQSDASGVNVTHDVWVNGHRAFATFDTGDSGYGFVTGHGISSLHLDRLARSGKRTTVSGYNGSEAAMSGKLGDVHIGKVAAGAIDVRFLPATGDPFDLNIGNQTLERYVVTFDYARGLLTLSSQKICPTP